MYITDKNFNSVIVFTDGTKIFGKSCGIMGEVAAEICFTTAMSGYQETITDPSYAGQAIVFGFPHIGNTGVNDLDVESGGAHTKAIIIRNKPTIDSNHQSKMPFDAWIKEQNLLAIYDVDTRAIIHKIRAEGAQNIVIASYEEGTEIDLERLQNLAINYKYSFVEVMREISANQLRQKLIADIVDESKKFKRKLAVIDYGVKLNILRCLVEQEFNIEIIPHNAIRVDFNQFDGIVLSNGPADPAEAVKENPELIDAIYLAKKPILGICLGHQIIALTFEKLKTPVTKMHQGHRGINHPIKNLITGVVEITSQNHGFAAFIPENDERMKYVSHKSLFDGTIAGFCLPQDKVITIQYHPESSPGTHDSRYLFQEFSKMIRGEEGILIHIPVQDIATNIIGL